MLAGAAAQVDAFRGVHAIERRHVLLRRFTHAAGQSERIAKLDAKTRRVRIAAAALEREAIESCRAVKGQRLHGPFGADDGVGGGAGEIAAGMEVNRHRFRIGGS